MEDKIREKWERLYECTKRVVKLEPWKWIKEEQLIEIEAYEGLNFYMSVMGYHGMFEGIMLFTNKKDLFSYVEMQEKPFPEFHGMNYQQGVLMVFNERKYMLPENIKIADEIMKRQIKGKLIAFESFIKGYMPSQITEEELDDSIIAFFSFAKALELFDSADNKKKQEEYKEDKEVKDILQMKKKFVNKFDKCMHIVYDEDEDKVKVEITKLPEISEFVTECVAPKEIIDEINTFEKVKDCYEIEFLNYLPLPIGKVKYKTPFMSESIEKVNTMRYIIIASEKKGLLKFKLIDRPFMSEEDHFEYYNQVLDELMETLRKSGVPNELVIRDDDTKFVLEHLCKELNIELIDDPNLLVIDEVLSNFIEHLMEEEENEDDDDEE